MELLLVSAIGDAPHTKWSAPNVIVKHLDWLRPTLGAARRTAAEVRFALAIDDQALKTRALEFVVAG